MTSESQIDSMIDASFLTSVRIVSTELYRCRMMLYRPYGRYNYTFGYCLRPCPPCTNTRRLWLSVIPQSNELLGNSQVRLSPLQD
jgi:hypothetical protein